MALLMLLSSTGFSMDIHYCQNQFAGFSFIGKASCCKKAVNTKPCHSVKTKKLNGINQAEKDNCCHNESIVIEKADLDATNVQYGTINDIQFDFVVVPVSVAEFLINYNAQLDVVPFDQYKPPLPDRDIQVLYQTFLI
jgi:hypothetical protein